MSHTYGLITKLKTRIRQKSKNEIFLLQSNNLGNFWLVKMTTWLKNRLTKIENYDFWYAYKIFPRVIFRNISWYVAEIVVSKWDVFHFLFSWNASKWNLWSLMASYDVIIINHNLYDKPSFKFVSTKNKNFIYSPGGVRELIEVLQ